MNTDVGKKRFPFLTLLQSVCIGVLVGAFFKQPDGYQLFLRLAVCAVAGYTAYSAAQNKSIFWVLVFGALAVLYNPVATIELDSGSWLCVHFATAVLTLCESGGTRSLGDWAEQCKGRLILLLYSGVLGLIVGVWCSLFVGSLVAIYCGLIGNCGSSYPHIDWGWRAFLLILGSFLGFGLLLSARDGLKHVRVAVIEEVTGKAWSPETSANFEIKFPKIDERSGSLFFKLGVLLAIVGLVVLCSNQSIFVLLPEGLLLIFLGRRLGGWLRRWGPQVVAPLIVSNPALKALLWLASVAAFLGGLVITWAASPVVASVIAFCCLIRSMSKAAKNTDEAVIKLIINAYKICREKSAGKPERTVLMHTMATVLSIWHVPEDKIRGYLERFDCDSINSLVVLLLIHRDSATGSNHVPDIANMALWAEKGDKRDELVKQLLAGGQ